MAFLTSLRSWFVPADTKPTSIFSNIPVFVDGGGAASADVDAILGLPPVEACINIVARSVSQVGLGVKVKQDRSWVEPTSGALADLDELLSSLPNADTTAAEFFDQIARDALSTQTAYAVLLRDGRGDVRSLRRLEPAWVETSRDEQGRKTWTVKVPGREPKTYVLSDPSRPPILDIQYHSPVFACPAFWNFALAVYAVGGRFFAHGARPQGMLQTPSQPTAEEANSIRQTWRALTADGGGPVVLPDALKWTPLGSTLEEAQLIALLAWVTETVAALFGVPPSRLGLPQRTSYASLEADAKSLVSQAVNPFLKTLTHSLRRDLLSNDQYRRVRIHVDTSGLIPVDSDTQARTLSALRLAGVLSVNEVRAELGRDPIDGGDEYVTPLNVASPLDGTDPKAPKTENQNG